MPNHEKLNYVEFPANDIPATKRFFEQAFGWQFEGFGPEYTAFTDQGLNGGFYQSSLMSNVERGSALLVLLSDDLEQSQVNVQAQALKFHTLYFHFLVAGDFILSNLAVTSWPFGKKIHNIRFTKVARCPLLITNGATTS